MTQALAILRKPFRVPTVEELLSRSSVDGTLLKPTSSCDMSESGTSGDSLSCSSDDDGTCHSPSSSPAVVPAAATANGAITTATAMSL